MLVVSPWCCARLLITVVFAFIALFRFDEPVSDRVSVLTSWAILHVVLYRAASLFSIRVGFSYICQTKSVCECVKFLALTSDHPLYCEVSVPRHLSSHQLRGTETRNTMVTVIFIPKTLHAPVYQFD